MTLVMPEPNKTVLAMIERLNAEAARREARAASCLTAAANGSEGQDMMLRALVRQVEAKTLREVASAMYDARDGNLDYFHNLGA